MRIQYQLEQLKYVWHCHFAPCMLNLRLTRPPPLVHPRQQIEAKKPLAGEREDRNQAIFRELGELKKQQKQLLDKVMQAEAEREARRKEWVRLCRIRHRDPCKLIGC